MKVLDLCSGTGQATKAFADRGHYVVRLDNDPIWNPDWLGDVCEYHPVQFDFVWASPPCTAFSVASIRTHWRNEWPSEAFGVVAHCLRVISEARPRYWALENPRGMLRTLLGKPRYETTFAAWQPGGHLKPTDIWGVLPDMPWPPATDWQPNPRGSKHPDADIPIPYALGEAICKAIEDSPPRR